ncbi:hypothetical protein Q5P01_009443 [Channa striata]|uniref:BPTI/Kunitz inhibitor domain-containing protein n=1 Tax=Channa striata TaxID=64152 RepID=A0AA88SQS2_CHASR|nr:hypothetical protein Q5P01_009443 [Channa striata]
MENWFSTSLLALWFLICSGMALGCDWDKSVDLHQDLDPVAMQSLQIRLDHAVRVVTTEECQVLCCNDPNCDMALIGFPADGPKQCLLVNCWAHGWDQCTLRNSSQFNVYRRKVDPKTREAQDGEPHISPLLLDTEPKAVDPKETNQTNDIICRQPVKVGSCRAAFPKFFYNVTDQSCSSFIYGGCEGNGNNFDSKDECEKTCTGVTGPVLDDTTPSDTAAKSPRMAPPFYPELSKEAESPAETEPTESVHLRETEMSAKEYAVHCEVEPEAGPCRAAFTRWFYNHKTGNCEKFKYGGCRGNKNNYDSKESCAAACTVSVLPSSKKPSPEDNSAEYKVHCEVEPEAGPCRAAFTRWFYNHKTGNCEMFTYGGCRGNENNYDSKESCTAACTVFFDSQGEDHHGRTAALFLFVTLAAISVLLLVAVVVVSLRRHRRSRRSSSSDKQELLPEGDLRSSQESLSVPNSPKPDKA